MTKDELVAQTREIFDLWNAHDAPGLARFFANGATYRDAAYPDNAATGQDAIVERARMILGGFSDAKLEVVSISVDGNRVCSEWRFSGTHDGVFLGVPASGLSVDNLGATVAEVDEDGKVVSETAYYDNARFFAETGALRASAATGAGS
jgi:steroid delta-isomerase-like uncharacterized protein